MASDLHTMIAECSRLVDELPSRADHERVCRERDEAIHALELLLGVIDAAGLRNLSNGVQLGATSWYVKAVDARNYARKVLGKPSCPYCGTTDRLRQVHDGGGFTDPEYTCEGCFTPSDDGPCFDDLPKAEAL